MIFLSPSLWSLSLFPPLLLSSSHLYFWINVSLIYFVVEELILQYPEFNKRKAHFNLLLLFYFTYSYSANLRQIFGHSHTPQFLVFLWHLSLSATFIPVLLTDYCGAHENVKLHCTEQFSACSLSEYPPTGEEHLHSWIKHHYSPCSA